MGYEENVRRFIRRRLDEEDGDISFARLLGEVHGEFQILDKTFQEMVAIVNQELLAYQDDEDEEDDEDC